MCGRYALDLDHDELVRRYGFSIIEMDFGPRYNIAPTQTVPVVTATNDGKALRGMRWGLVPSWAKDESIGNRMINARAETVHEKPSFKRPLKTRRCIVPATGYYEWKKPTATGRTKTPYYFTASDDSLFSFAGLWDSWKKPDGDMLHTFTILTTEPNELARTIHNRMPVILTPKQQAVWLDHKLEDVTALRSLLVPYPSEAMDVYEVSQLVNSPRNDSPECLAPIA